MLAAQLFTPDETYADHRPLYEARIGLYTDILARHGVALTPVRWTEAVPDRPALACLSWGYHLAPARWLALIGGWPEAVPLINPPALLGWNTDKHYLADLEVAGVPTIPTRFVGVADVAALAQARAAFGAEELVVKPRISGGAWRTHRVAAADPAPLVPDAMIQPFLPAVAGEGELSLIHFAGRFSHGIRKVAAPGDFRVQRELGGVFSALSPDAEALGLATAALAATPAPAAYARIDLIRRPDGRLAVMELEAIEPDFYLDLVPEAGDAFGAAVTATLVSGESLLIAAQRIR